ncbi:MAG: histidine kinase [Bacteroidota bacterium]
MLIRSLIVIFLLCWNAEVKSQSQYRFSTLGLAQGLSSAFAWSINQDKYGFIWIGTTNGLNRYDGHNIKQYLNDPKDSFSFPGNTVYWIHRDADGEMWFACGDKGVAKYDYAKDRFEKFKPFEEIKKQSGKIAPVWRVGEDQRKRIYFACGGACFRYSKTAQKAEDLTPLFKGKIDDYGVAMLVKQGADTLWILTDNGLFLHILSTNVLESIPYDKEALGFGSAALIDACFISENEMMITIPKAGFVLFDTKTKKFRKGSSVFDPSVTGVYSSCGGTVRDKSGRIWSANSMYGLIEYLPKTNKVISVKQEASYPYPSPEQEGSGMNVFEDRDGNIWYGTSQQGVVSFQPKLNFIKVYNRNYADSTSLMSDVVYGFAPDAANGMFIATGKGLTHLNNGTHKFHHFPVALNNTQNFPAASIRSILADDSDSIFLATDGGLSLYNQRSNTFKRFVAKDESAAGEFNLFTNRLDRIYKVRPNELILISNTGTAARFDLLTGKCYYKNNAGARDPLYDFTSINCSYHDKIQQCIWLEANEGELYQYYYKEAKAIRHYYSNDTAIKLITVLKQDANGGIWLGTKPGLVYYHPITKIKKLFRLPTASQHVYNIGLINDGTVWATTNNEIIKLDPINGSAMALNLNTLMPYATIYARSLLTDYNNNLWIGTNKGFCVIYTKRFKWEANRVAPQLVNFKVFDKQRNFDVPHPALKSLSLNYDENFFSFDFSVLDFSQSNGISYAYFLQGFDKDWTKSEKNVASYTNVPPGNYSLRLRTEYGRGKWMESEPVTIRINPPFWRTWWAISLFAGMLMACLYFAFQLWRKRRTKNRIDKTIDYFANSVYGKDSVNEICWDIARNCIAQLKFRDSVVYLWNKERNKLLRVASYGENSQKGFDLENIIETNPVEGSIGIVAGTGKPLLIEDTSIGRRDITKKETRLSELVVPIMHDNRVIGIIESTHAERNFFTQGHLKALTTIAAISANKIAEATAGALIKENEIKVLEINKLLAESQLMALRAQMNPHFVFNCLNSIQECIVTQKYGEASKYLNKFSKLFRMVLNNSGRKLVTMAEEKLVLELYLELEQMRFETSFDYTIVIDDELDADEILIPSMLLQPYVENALWHGLMHKPGDRKLRIEFRLLNNDVFECIIDDNGIGRSQSFALKATQSKARHHESKGLAICEARLNVLQRQGYHVALRIEDKKDETGNATGTKISIELPTELLN